VFSATVCEHFTAVFNLDFASVWPCIKFVAKKQRNTGALPKKERDTWVLTLEKKVNWNTDKKFDDIVSTNE
jgi:hypothetical protein